MGEHIEFPSNGTTGGGYLAVPTPGSGPGVVVIQEWWGLVPHIESVADRLAGAGFVALAPDLYHGAKVPVGEPDEAGKQMMALKLDQAAKDMSGAVEELRRRASGDAVGAIGFCMGGGLAMMLATQRPDAVKACVSFYGAIPWPGVQPDYSALDGELQVHVAERDEWFSPDAAKALEQRLGQLGKRAQFHVYEGAEHAFFNDDRPEVYDAAAAALAWGRTLDFLHAQLG